MDDEIPYILLVCMINQDKINYILSRESTLPYLKWSKRLVLPSEGVPKDEIMIYYQGKGVNDVGKTYYGAPNSSVFMIVAKIHESLNGLYWC